MNENSNNFYPNNEPFDPNTVPVSPDAPAAQPAQPEQPYSAPTQPDYSIYNDPVDIEIDIEDYHDQGTSQGDDGDASVSETDSTAETAPAAKKKNRGFKAFVISSIAIIVCVAILLVSYPALSGRKNPSAQTPSGEESGIVLSPSPDLSAYTESLSTIEIAEKVEKINVGILIYSKNQSFITGSADSLEGEGSGIIMKVDKTRNYTLILTCAHVVTKAQKSGYTITVQDSDGNTYDATLVGLDAKTDIGIVKVASANFTVAEFGDSSALRKGQKVFAIGNPGGTEFFGSFTEGMISSIDRPISSESGYEMKCIQHTTPINSGNSGGALLNEFGQVIGINSAKIVSTGYEGMAFAIPISDALPIIDDIVANGHVTNRPKLGITYTPAMQNQQYAMLIQMKNLPAGSLIIASIAADSSLAKTQAKPYDLITKVDGQPLDTADVLLDKIENGKIGDKLKLTLCRINDDYSIEEFEVTATLVEDTGASVPTEEPTTQGFWDQYFNDGF